MAVSSEAVAAELLKTGVDMPAIAPTAETPTVSGVSSSAERIGGGNIAQIYENAQKAVMKAKDSTEKDKLVQKGNEMARELEEKSGVAVRIQELESQQRHADAVKIRGAINSKTLREELPPAVQRELSEYDSKLAEIMRLDERAKGMGISDSTENTLQQWDGFLYDASLGTRVDMAQKYRQLQQKAKDGIGQEQTDAQRGLGEIKEGVRTPQILKLCFQMQDALKTNGIPFQEYLQLKQKAAKTEKDGKNLSGAELLHWETARAAVNHVFAGHEDDLAILTGDFEGKDYKTTDGKTLTNADKSVLGAVRNMVDIMARAYDGKGLGGTVRSEVFPEQQAAEVRQEATSVMAGAEKLSPEVLAKAMNSALNEARTQLGRDLTDEEKPVFMAKAVEKLLRGV